MDLISLENKLKNISNDLKKEDKKLNKLIKYSFLNDDSYQYYDLIDNDQKHYLLMKKNYKNLIHQFSIPYLEMSDWYIGEDLSYHEYCKIFYPTYLDSKKDIQELYSLFLFYSILSLYLPSIPNI